MTEWRWSKFGEEHFGAAQLGDHRRTKRLVQLADKMVMHPGGTLPDKIDDPASLKALYRLVNREEVTHATVLAPSRERTLRLMREVEGTVLVIQDTTELDFSGLASLEGLGAIGNGGCRGYLAHNALAVVAHRRPERNCCRDPHASGGRRRLPHGHRHAH